ncbi:gas vesicle structural protein GvpA [Streptomyces sp. enrichment culture]|uniref:gas vesicle structural protein GvpA n=1 Tax=Streptomyces sp. enrichment culture TaxID=1795815 RepID=UPI003F57DCA9
MITYDDEVVCAPRAGTLYDVLELILDRGMVIDVFVRVSLVGIEILKVDARIVVASVDTYLRFAEACNRLDLEHDVRSKTVPELFGGPVAKSVGKGAARGVRRKAHSLTDKVRDALTPEESDDPEDAVEEEPEARSRAREREERSRAPQRARSRPAARSRDDDGDGDDRPRSRPRRRTETEEE